MESFFVIETLACSTKLTQNPSLLGLLKWRHNPNSVQQTVKHITYVNGEEVVKFLTDIFDAVFAILDRFLNFSLSPLSPFYPLSHLSPHTLSSLSTHAFTLCIFLCFVFF